MAVLNPDQMLQEFIKLLREMPSLDDFVARHENVAPWLGKCGAIVGNLSHQLLRLQLDFRSDLRGVSSGFGILRNETIASHFASLQAHLHEAIYNFEMETGAYSAEFVEQGKVFQYFEMITSKIETATADILFVDPYIDVEFIKRYLPFVKDGTHVRLLIGKNYVEKIKPAIKLWMEQNNTSVEIRITQGLHDRFMFLDGRECFSSGASFKDGAKNSSTTLTPFIDTFPQLYTTYEEMWGKAEKLEW